MSASVAMLPETTASNGQQHVLHPRTLLNIQVPPGTLKMMIGPPANGTGNHVCVASIQETSPVIGKLMPGDWLLSINGMPVTSRDAGVELFQATAASIRTVCVSRVIGGGAPVVNDKENGRNAHPVVTATKSVSVPKPAATTKPLPDTIVLLGMTATQLKEELASRDLLQTGTKDTLLERLGLPARQWKQWRKMKISELKPLLQQRGLTVSGTKHELLTRLGVPVGFGETKHETWERQHRELNKKKRKLEELSHKVIQVLKKKIKSPEDDPTHEEYQIPCCKSPRFDCRNNEPAGMIRFPDGSMMEVWRCLACGEIPKRPNAPPVEEFSDNEEEEEVYGFPFGHEENFYW